MSSPAGTAGPHGSVVKQKLRAAISCNLQCPCLMLFHVISPSKTRGGHDSCEVCSALPCIVEIISVRRVLIIGCAGAGKSTFAAELAHKTNLPLIHLDREFWRPGWVHTPRDEWRTKIAELAARDAWIMDGNYDSSLDLRLPRADTVIWFDYPRFLCLRRVLKRIATTYGKVRPDMAPGCREQFDFQFLLWIWNFNRRERPAVLHMIATSGRHLTLVIFRRDPDVAQFLALL
jgi:adenylate kinase family enzyme